MDCNVVEVADYGAQPLKIFQPAVPIVFLVVTFPVPGTGDPNGHFFCADDRGAIGVASAKQNVAELFKSSRIRKCNTMGEFVVATPADAKRSENIAALCQPSSITGQSSLDGCRAGLVSSYVEYQTRRIALPSRDCSIAARRQQPAAFIMAEF